MEKHCPSISTSGTQLCPAFSGSLMSFIIPVQPFHRQNRPSKENDCTDYFKGLPLRLQKLNIATHIGTATSQMFIHSETSYLSRRNVYLATVSVGMK